MKYISIINFVAEQNRFLRTNGLPADHPNGELEPFDVPLSAMEKAFWDEQEQEYLNSISPYETEEELARLKKLYDI